MAKFGPLIWMAAKRSVLPGLERCIRRSRLPRLNRGVRFIYVIARGTSVHRCGYGSSDHENLIQRHVSTDATLLERMTNWCVGVAIDAERSLIYWTQKRQSKSGRGQIFCAGLDIPAGEDAGNRTEIRRLFDKLPEPIDIESDADLVSGGSSA